MKTLNEQSQAYAEKHFFTCENDWMHKAYDPILERYVKDRSVLELGIGYQLNIISLCQFARQIEVIEASSAVIADFRRNHPDLANRINIVEGYFETYQSNQLFDVVAMEFILEHVDDPLLVLKRFRQFLAPDGILLAAVPNAECLHRRIGHEMGLLPDMQKLSQADLNYGHQRYFTFASFTQMIEEAGYRVVEAKGLQLKPITTGQINQLQLGDSFFKAINTIGYDYPELSNSMFLAAQKV